MKPKAFQFKNFALEHSKSAHKIGTDGILLGAWTKGPAKKILDFGSGCGLISFILAQRFPQAKIHGLEIDPASFEESLNNLEQFALQNRISFKQADLFDLVDQPRFDLIVSNPPFYSEDTQSPEGRRAQARSGSVLDMIRKLPELLTPEGRIALVLPLQEWTRLSREILSLGLHPQRLAWVRHSENKDLKRILVELAREPQELLEEEIILHLPNSILRHPDYQALVKDLLLDQ